MVLQCDFGKNSYSTGIHRIRIIRHFGGAFIGIRSRHVQLETCGEFLVGLYFETPSTYGWFTNGARVVNGCFADYGIDVPRTDAIMIELILNCDEHRLTIAIDEDNSHRDEIKVDGIHAPCPWCFFVQHGRMGARLSLE
ncbi:unnamed protein product [Adineta steineri]|uniref:Uncharacterized protein n=1 Tax=Adineta steineri TaxID=433720 RepID=A0A814WWH5_9BILA|nr:unnamed protein product [Adineta steineri]CAF4154865.1 unnamed protein product [Adineta steineri]